MITKTKRIVLTLKTENETAREVAYEVYDRANAHQSTLVDKKLSELGINIENLTKYYEQLSLVVCEFWHSVDDVHFVPVLKSYEVRKLYLPLIYAVIFSSVGNMTIGNYSYVLSSDASQKSAIDKEFIFDFSAKLEEARAYVLGNTEQIGNPRAIPQTSVMMSICSGVAGKTAEVLVRDGTAYDASLSGLAALVGMSLVDIANSVLYTGEDEVNFRALVGTIKQNDTEKV
jgi:hypothetical protein